MKLTALFVLVALLVPQEGRRPAAIKIEGVPEIPAEIFGRLNQYQNVRSASLRDWTPDGKSLLIGTRFGSTNQLHLVYAAGGRMEQITFEADAISGAAVADDGSVIYEMGKSGNENFQIYRLDRRTGRSALLTDGKSRNNLGPLDSTRKRFAFSSTKRNGKIPDLYVHDLATKETRLLLEVAETGWGVASWSPDGSKALLYHYVSVNESTVHVLDVKSGKKTPVPIPGGVKAAHDAVEFAGPDAIYLSSDAEGEFRQLARIDLATMKYTWLTKDIPWDVTGLDVSGSKALFTVNEDGRTRLYQLEGDKRTAVDLPTGVVSAVRFSPDGSRAALTLNRPEAPGDVYVLADGKLERWTFSEVGGLDPSTFIAPTRIEYPSFDKRMIPAYYYRPRNVAKPPVIISIHGGPEGQYQALFNSMVQFNLVELGAAILAPNVRGSTGYGKTFVALDNAEKREDSVKDIGALLDWIAKQPDLDSSRVAVIGGSYGGYMVLASLVHYGERIRAGVDIVGIANFITFLEKTAGYRQDLRRVEYGDERDPKMREIFEKISPANHAEKIKSSLLVIHGREDPRVPVGEALQIASKVRETGRPVWTLIADDEGHGFQKKENSTYMNGVIVLFFQEHLLK
ncbi:MAG TPA: S9 family peptidase [Planctomycetota bacterium]|nr:S9 family peptidase [Planctomycetota bacterium]